MLVVVQVDSKSAGIRTKTFHKQERREGEKESIFARVQQAIVVLSFWRYFPGKMPKFQRYSDDDIDERQRHTRRRRRRHIFLEKTDF